MASLIMAIRRKIKKQPGIAADVATRHAIKITSKVACINALFAVFSLQPLFLQVLAPSCMYLFGR